MGKDPQWLLLKLLRVLLNYRIRGLSGGIYVKEGIKNQLKSGITKNLVKIAFIKTMPVMAGYIVLGMGFGILLKKAGYGLFWAFLMSFGMVTHLNLPSWPFTGVCEEKIVALRFSLYALSLFMRCILYYIFSQILF